MLTTGAHPVTVAPLVILVLWSKSIFDKWIKLFIAVGVFVEFGVQVVLIGFIPWLNLLMESLVKQ